MKKLSEWFDPYNIDHIKALNTLQNTGEWPKNFKPKNVEVNQGWYGLIKQKIVDAWIYEMIWVYKETEKENKL